MERFKDADGREWTVDLKWPQLREMRSRGFTVEAMAPDENGNVGVDSTLAIECLLIATADQRRAKNVSDDDFAGAMLLPIQDGLLALMREVMRFFRLPIPDAPPPEPSSPAEASSSTA